LSNISFRFNLTITQGDDRALVFVFSDDDGNPVDISTWEIFYTAKADYADPDVEALIALEPADFTASDSGTGTIDRVTANIPASATGAMAAGTYYQDLQVKKAGGLVSTIGRGQLVIDAQVTQRTS